MFLIIFGYGDVIFVVFYFNCYSVFGFYDEEAMFDKEYIYEIYGYYVEENWLYEYFDL